MKKFFYPLVIITSASIQTNAQCWAKVSVGATYALTIKNDGTLLARGGNFFDHPGDGTNTKQNQLRPCQGCSFHLFS